MAEYEAARRWYSTYFFLLRNPLYNLLQPENLDAVKRIAALGHGIGLHFDASLYQAANEAAIAPECDVLESMVGAPVRILSLHRPAKELHNHTGRVAGRLHAHIPQIGYCSDSRGGWYRGAPLEHEAIAKGVALQLVTHPIWWVAQENESATDKLIRIVAERHRQYEEALAYNITPYQEVLHPAA